MTLPGEKQREYPPINFETEEQMPSEAFSHYVHVGRKIIAWATGAEPTPKNMEELRKELGDGSTIFIPANMENLETYQGNDDDPTSTTFVLRLPPMNQLMESRQQMRDHGTGTYPTPKLYDFLIGEGARINGQAVDAEDVLCARVADYTMRGCR